MRYINVRYLTYLLTYLLSGKCLGLDLGWQWHLLVCSMLHHVGVCRGPEKFGALGAFLWVEERWWKHSPHVAYCAEFDVSWSNGMSIRTEIAGKLGPSRSAFHGHWRSLKMMRIDRLPISDAWKPWTYLVPLVRFRDVRRFRLKDASFSYPTPQ